MAFDGNPQTEVQLLQAMATRLGVSGQYIGQTEVPLLKQILAGLEALIESSSGGGAVTSVFGRTGAVTAANGDYTPAQVGATTVGGNFFQLTNPGAITFPRINANNTVTALNAADFRTAIGAGTSSFDAASPGTIGGTAPGAATFTTGTFTANGAASTPSVRLSGTIFSGGSASTTQPLFLVMPTGTSWTNGNTSGTIIGVDAPSGYNGNLLDLQTNNTRAFAVDRVGQVSFQTAIQGPSFWENSGNSFWADSTVGGTQTKATGYFGFSSTGNAFGAADLFIRRKAAATLQLGTDAAGVTNQTLTAANRITSDGVGASLTVVAGNGRGAAAGSLLLSSWTTEGAGVVGTLETIMTITTAGATIALGKSLKVGVDAQAEVVAGTHTIEILDASGVAYKLLAVPAI